MKDENYEMVKEENKEAALAAAEKEEDPEERQEDGVEAIEAMGLREHHLLLL